MNVKFAAVVVMAIFVAACSGKPTVDDVAKGLAITKDKCPGIEAFDIAKINGEEGSDDRHYNIEVSYKVRIADIKNICTEKYTNEFVSIAYIALSQKNGVKFQNGLIIPVQETKRMKKTDNGWVFDSDDGSE